MNREERREQASRINAYDLSEKQIVLLKDAAYSVVSFPFHPTTINGCKLESPIPNETMSRIRTNIAKILNDEIDLLRKEQAEI